MDDLGNLIKLTKLKLENGLQNGLSLFVERGTYVLMTTETEKGKRLLYKPLIEVKYMNEEQHRVISVHDDEKKNRHSSLQKRKSRSKQRT